MTLDILFIIFLNNLTILMIFQYKCDDRLFNIYDENIAVSKSLKTIQLALIETQRPIIV